MSRLRVSAPALAARTATLPQLRLLGVLAGCLALAAASCADGSRVAPADSSPASQDAADPPASATPPDERPSLIVITLDTTRADHLSCYGYPLATTPALDLRARTALRFERAYAPMAQTLPSHTTLFTGLSPREHGVTDNHRRLAPALVTLAETLASQGYDTAAFVSSAVLAADSGISQGFAHFEQGVLGGGRGRAVERDARAVTDAALSWLGQRRDHRPLFLWVHYFDPHLPYQAPEALMNALDVEPIVSLLARRAAQLDAARIAVAGAATGATGMSGMSGKASATDAEAAATEAGVDGPRLDSDIMALYWRAYDAEIRYTDHHLARLFRGLAARHLTDGAVVLVVGDHGEGLFDHGERGHGVNLYEELLRVPLLLWSPGGELSGAVIEQPIALAQIHDTLLRLCLGAQADVSQPTLWEQLLTTGRPRPAPLFVERPHYSREQLEQRGGKDDPQRYVFGEMVGVIAAQLKLIVDPDGNARLFDLSSDPLELQDVAASRPEDVERLRDLLDHWRVIHPLQDDLTEPDPLSAERRAALEQLGYGH